jgi:hypothetical protein
VSRISGHYAITRRALSELRREDPEDVFLRDFQNAGPTGPPSDDDFARVEFLGPYQQRVVGTTGFDQEHVAPGAMVFMLPSNKFVTTLCDGVVDLADGAVCKDLEDILDGKHWSRDPDAQAGHFMRAPGAKPGDAYDAALRWIVLNVNGAALEMAHAYARSVPPGAAGADRRRGLPPAGSGKLTGGIAAKLLGRAVHCVQDSFSSSHVQRAHGTEMAPGAIEDIYCYLEQDPKVHEVADRAWMRKGRIDETLGGKSPRPARFTTTGLEAVNATKAVISLATWAARRHKVEVDVTERWRQLCAQWLPCAPFFRT